MQFYLTRNLVFVLTLFAEPTAAQFYSLVDEHDEHDTMTSAAVKYLRKWTVGWTSMLLFC